MKDEGLEKMIQSIRAILKKEETDENLETSNLQKEKNTKEDKKKTAAEEFFNVVMDEWIDRKGKNFIVDNDKIDKVLGDWVKNNDVFLKNYAQKIIEAQIIQKFNPEKELNSVLEKLKDKWKDFLKESLFEFFQEKMKGEKFG